MRDGPREPSLPPALAAWFSIEENVTATLDALRVLNDETADARTFLTLIHDRVRIWLSWELWAAILRPGHYTPDTLLAAILNNEVDLSELPRENPATPPNTGEPHEWRAFPAENGHA